MNLPFNAEAESLTNAGNNDIVDIAIFYKGECEWTI